MNPEVRVTGVFVDAPEEVCVPTFGQDPGDCARHDHIPGARPMPRVEVVPVDADQATVDALTRLVGRKVALAPVEEPKPRRWGA